MKLSRLIAIVGIFFISALTVQNIRAEQAEKATAVFTVQPEMHCQNCENKIKTNLRFEKGVSDVTTDLKTKTVKIVYDKHKTSPEKITEAFKKIGYTATEVTSENSQSN